MKNNSGQSMLEALFVVVFTTVIMFSFLQICIMAVDDMTANEAAFVAMRSAAVTIGNAKSDGNGKLKEAKSRVENYMLLFYPFSIIYKGDTSPSKFAYSDKKTVDKYFHAENSDGEENDDTGDSIAIYPNDDSGKKSYDYSDNLVHSHTVKIYYFTRVMFGSLVAKLTYKKDAIYSGARRYQSARSRMVPSPDWKFYYKAYPGAKNFDEN